MRIRALAIQQTAKRTIYSFAVDGKVLPSIAAISRIKRDEGGDILGYQRPGVLSHISEIRSYLESDDPMIPNALVVAFDSRVRFEPDVDQDQSSGLSRTGTLVVPIVGDDDTEGRPGWIVDGQQRAAAIRDARITAFPICVTAFVAANETQHREQFILVNSTKPLPKGLIYELLPTTETRLSTALQRRRFPALLVDRLNRDLDSPFRGLVDSPTNPEGFVKDNSLLRMIENSLSDGVLYRLRGTADDPNVDVMVDVMKSYWRAVSTVFQSAWGLPPRRSRLLHGVGIVSLGFLMDAIADRHRGLDLIPDELFLRDLTPMVEVCRWTDGFWELGPGAQRRWNELQNTGKDIALLTNFLLHEFRSRSRRAA